MSWLLPFLITGISLLVADYFIQGIQFTGIAPAVLAALVLGIVNAIIRPVLIFFTLPLTVFTLGLFILVINAVTFTLTAMLVPGFNVFSFGGAFWGAIITSLVSWLLNSFFLER